MTPPPYVRGLIDLFSTGKRVGITLSAIGLSVTIIAASSSFVSHANSYNYSGPLVTGSGGLYAGIFITILGLLAIIGDIRYSVMQRRAQEMEGQQRLRAAEDKLADPLKVSATDGAADEGDIRLRASASDVLALSALWDVTNARLSRYHQIATTQAKRSFTTAQWAIAVGFLLLVGFAVLSFRTQSAAAAIATGTLGAVSAALAGYVGRTFVRSQELSANHLRSYFDQPLEFSRYLAAERLLASQQDTPEAERVALLKIIITGMIGDADLPLAGTEKTK